MWSCEKISRLSGFYGCWDALFIASFFNISNRVFIGNEFFAEKIV